jgi:dCMP deaminase
MTSRDEEHDIVRPSWDETWMIMATAVSHRSHDPKFKVGCLVVSDKNTHVLSVGYNGAPPGWPHVRDSDEPGKSGFIHAEANCLIKMNFNDPAKKIMYVTLSPCADCARLVVAAGIEEVVYMSCYRDMSGLDVLARSGIPFRQFEPERKIVF